jgi:glycosyltransferase involved in cell wall biosynthesis
MMVAAKKEWKNTERVMRIAFDQQVFCLQKHGGISRYFAELVRHIARQPHVDACIVAPLHINEYLCSPGVRARVRGQRFPFDFRGNSPLVRSFNSIALPLYWARRAYDIIHETYYSLESRGRARLRILTIYDMIHELYPHDFPDSAQVSAAKRAAALRADHVICISETTRQDAIRILGISPDRSSVIYLGWSLDDADSKVALDEKASRYILYVGRRNGYKNFRVVLEAFASSPKLKAGYELIAFGGRRLSADEEREIGELGLTGRVKQVGGNDALLSAYYGGATAFVYPSRYEGFGIPPLEAMSHGCPVVCSSAGSISEIVGDAAAYFEPDDSAKLRSLLERVTEDERFAADLTARGTMRINKYSWEACSRETLDAYRRLLGEQAK